ncbi:hypothetical protein ACHHYP_03156 [Achlya hypogyna]|uniref:Phosphatidic acid phosphatase type 2/haloperoxidase domain-containing protein n=1 Tax=Achlya hypogyna TaxID=1202772 RepID=A0A1V9Z4C5_ACHHY|nr:hypothetical protein ACHHYP_03156 [Achlya hypogyna]
MSLLSDVQWVSPLLSAVLVGISAAWAVTVTPSRRYLDTYNPTISEATSHPELPDTVSYGALVGYCVLVWFAAVGLVEGCLHRRTGTPRDVVVRVVNLSLGCIEAICLAVAVTTVTKMLVGYLRPNFAALCAPDLVGNATYLCSASPSVYEASMVSFPSAHACTGTACGLYSTMYLLWTLYVRPRPNSISAASMAWCRQVLFVPTLLPVVLAGAVSVSRVTDFKHHTVDITMGTLLGLMFAALTAVRVYATLKPEESAATTGAAGPS